MSPKLVVLSMRAPYPADRVTASTVDPCSHCAMRLVAGDDVASLNPSQGPIKDLTR